MKYLIQIPFLAIFLLLACNGNNGKISLINENASLPTSFKFSDFGLKIMASFVDKNNGTTSILYANEIALNKANRGDSLNTAGDTLALVTWKQKADDYWFGARVPGMLQSVELVNTLNDGKGGFSTSYIKYVGDRLVADPNTDDGQERTKYILNQRPSIMP